MEPELTKRDSPNLKDQQNMAEHIEEEDIGSSDKQTIEETAKSSIKPSITEIAPFGGASKPTNPAEENKSLSQDMSAESLEQNEPEAIDLEESHQPGARTCITKPRQKSDSMKDAERLLRVIIEKHGEGLLILINDFECRLSKEVISLFKVFADKIQIKIVYVNEVIADFADFREALEKITNSCPPVVFFKKNFICNYADAINAKRFRHLDLLLEPQLCPLYHIVIIGSGPGAQSAIEEIASLYQRSKLRYKIALVEWIPPVSIGDARVVGLLPQGNLPRKVLWNGIREADFLNQSVPLFEEEELSEDGRFERCGDTSDSTTDAVWSYWTFRDMIATLDIHYYHGDVEFIGPNKICVSTYSPPDNSDESPANSDHGFTDLVGMRFIICGGSRPRIEELAGFKNFVTIDRFLNGSVLPKAALILGNSLETLETAHLIASYGGNVTVVTKSNKWLPTYDQECVKKIIASFHVLNVQFLKNSKIVYIKASKSGYKVRVKVGHWKHYTKLYSTVIADFGRVPISADINVQRAGVQIDPESQKIIVSSEFKSTNQSIWAFGETVSGHLGTPHFESLAGKRVVNLILNGVDNVGFPKLFPQSVLTPLEYGFVGETEKSARLNYKKKINVYESENVAMPMINCMDQQMRFSNPPFQMKIICVDHWHCSHKEAVERVVGIHFLGPNAGRLVSGFAASIEKGITRKQFIAQILIKGSTELGQYQADSILNSIPLKETLIPPTTEVTRENSTIQLCSTNVLSLQSESKSQESMKGCLKEPNPNFSVAASPHAFQNDSGSETKKCSKKNQGI